MLYVISYIDRANIGYAALQMNAELALTSEAFGFAAGIFFIGYFLFEVPSNMAARKFGARVWIGRILITWGIVAVLTAFVQTRPALRLRFLLGVAEAGFFPGIIIYLTYWFRAKDQAITVALFTAAIPVSYLMGAPLSTWIMDNVSGFGLSGWRWMLILEGLPAVLGGVVAISFSPTGPSRPGGSRRTEGTGSSVSWRRIEAARQTSKHLGDPARDHQPKVLSVALSTSSIRPAALASATGCRRSSRGSQASLTNFEVGLRRDGAVRRGYGGDGPVVAAFRPHRRASAALGLAAAVRGRSARLTALASQSRSPWR